MKELWRPVQNYDDYYEVSNTGRVRSIRNNIFLKPGATKDGYLFVGLSLDGNLKTFRVHSLVAESFIGPRPGNFQVNHIDLCKANNNVKNLEYISQQENIKHAAKMGRYAKKLTAELVRDIRNLSETGKYSQRKLGTMFGITHGTVWSIIHNKVWREI